MAVGPPFAVHNALCTQTDTTSPRRQPGRIEWISGTTAQYVESPKLCTLRRLSTALASAKGAVAGRALSRAAGGQVATNIRDHGHFVLGVAWDPAEELILTVSSDRSARFHSSASGRCALRGRARSVAARRLPLLAFGAVVLRSVKVSTARRQHAPSHASALVAFKMPLWTCHRCPRVPALSQTLR